VPGRAQLGLSIMHPQVHRPFGLAPDHHRVEPGELHLRREETAGLRIAHRIGKRRPGHRCLRLWPDIERR
jgi:hypothetical protein